MKKALLVLLVCALVIGSVVHVKVATASDDNENIVKKPIDVYLIIPTGKQTLYNDHISALMARYNTKVLDEEHISLLPSPKVGMCFVTFGDKNILRGQLKKLGVKFNVEELPVSEDEIKEIREKSEEEMATLSPGTKIVWDDSNKRYSVLYGVGILPNGITDEIECESNLEKPDLQSIENWLDEFYMH
jgi:hypothetical protein